MNPSFTHSKRASHVQSINASPVMVAWETAKSFAFFSLNNSTWIHRSVYLYGGIVGRLTTNLDLTLTQTKKFVSQLWFQQHAHTGSSHFIYRPVVTLKIWQSNFHAVNFLNKKFGSKIRKIFPGIRSFSTKLETASCAKSLTCQAIR